MRQRGTRVLCSQGMKGASMDNVRISGIGISKRFFQVHGATSDGVSVLRTKLSRAKVLKFLAS